jgi:hypothetical protein
MPLVERNKTVKDVLYELEQGTMVFYDVVSPLHQLLECMSASHRHNCVKMTASQNGNFKSPNNTYIVGITIMCCLKDEERMDSDDKWIQPIQVAMKRLYC